MKSTSNGCDSKAVESGGHGAWYRNLRWRLIWAVVAGLVAATGWSLVLSWTSGLPRVSDVSLAAAAERGNTPSTWLATFVVAACAAFLLQWFVHSLISLLIRFCRRGPRRTGR